MIPNICNGAPQNVWRKSKYWIKRPSIWYKQILLHNFCSKVVSGGADVPDANGPVRQPAGGVGGGPDVGQGTSYWWYKHFLFHKFCSKMKWVWPISSIFKFPLKYGENASFKINGVTLKLHCSVNFNPILKILADLNSLAKNLCSQKNSAQKDHF